MVIMEKPLIPFGHIKLLFTVYVLATGILKFSFELEHPEIQASEFPNNIWDFVGDWKFKISVKHITSKIIFNT